MRIVGAFVLAHSLLWSLAYGDASNLNPNGEGCVDPSGYIQCYQNNTDQLDSCMEEVKQTCSADTLTECELACGYSQLAANIGCWLTSCWNQVYSCAYQETVLQYLTGADLEQGPTPVPYYPAPDNAPGGCVCNLGYIWGNFTVTYSLQNPCSAYDIVSAGVGPEASCQCCWDSSILSDIVEMCPHNDLSDLSIDRMLDAFESGYNNSASDQCSILADGNQCVTSFGLDTVASTWYNPGQLPSGFPGTAPLSDTSGSLTSAPAPYTYSVFPSYISVITPAPYNAKNAAGTGTVAETSSATGTAAAGTSATGTAAAGTSATGTSAKATSGSTTGSTTGAASSSTGQKGAAANLVSQISFGYGTWGLAIQMFACTLFSGAVVA